MRTNTNRRTQRGVTLIELMIVVAVVAVLGSIAVGSYRSYSIRANRAEAKAALLNLQAAQEKYYLNAHEYGTLADLVLPGTTERGMYTIVVNRTPDKQGYSAVATPAGSQVADGDCPSFTIDETGQRLPAISASPCWK